MSVPNTLQDIITKVRKITARPTQAQISDSDIVNYINTFYIYDMSEHIKMESLRVNYQFVTSANIPVYDFPTALYLTTMPPVFIAGYQSYMTQSRDNFFRTNPEINLLQQSIMTGNGTAGPYTGTITSVPVLRGFKPNPPGAFSATPVQARFLNWNVLISGTDSNGNSQTLVDDGLGNLVDPNDPAVPPSSPVVRGSVNYASGAVSINSTGFPGLIASGNAINIQYVPYVASRPLSACFFQDQIYLYPIPDQAYTVSFEAYQYPSAFLASATTSTPQVNEWWQLLAYGAADKIFSDNADFDNMQKFRPLLDEQMRLCLRRTLVQQASERAATIYTEQNGPYQYGFGQGQYGGF